MKTNVSDAEWRKRVSEKKGVRTGIRMTFGFSRELQLFIQVLLISLGHLGTAFFFAYMHYVEANVYLAATAQLLWISAHGRVECPSVRRSLGMPGVVYLTMNTSVRNDVLKNLGIGEKGNRIQASSTGAFSELELATIGKDWEK